MTKLPVVQSAKSHNHQAKQVRRDKGHRLSLMYKVFFFSSEGCPVPGCFFFFFLGLRVVRSLAVFFFNKQQRKPPSSYGPGSGQWRGEEGKNGCGTRETLTQEPSPQKPPYYYSYLKSTLRCLTADPVAGHPYPNFGKRPNPLHNWQGA